MERRRRAAVLVLRLMLVLIAPLLATGTAGAQEEFHGIMERVGFGDGLSWRRAFTIRIQAYTTDDELEALQRLLNEHGAQALQDRLADLDLARLQFTGQASVNIGLVRSMATGGGGRVIQLILANPVSRIGGAPLSWRQDEAFGVIDLRLDESGTGAGEYHPIVEIHVDGEGAFLIDRPSRPLRITSVEAR